MRYIKSLYDNITTVMLNIHDSIESRADTLVSRAETILSIKNPIVKNAFDTRRINQETDFNPRRNLQYYQRSEPFITKEAADQIKVFHKLKDVIDDIKVDFIGDPDWLDSHARILCNAIDRTLRTNQNDLDFSKSNIDYLSEMLYLRYRLDNDIIQKSSHKDLKDLILGKDEKLFLKISLGKIENNTRQIKNSISKTNNEDQRTINLTINL